MLFMYAHQTAIGPEKTNSVIQLCTKNESRCVLKKPFLPRQSELGRCSLQLCFEWFLVVGQTHRSEVLALTMTDPTGAGTCPVATVFVLRNGVEPTRRFRLDVKAMRPLRVIRQKLSLKLFAIDDDRLRCVALVVLFFVARLLCSWSAILPWSFTLRGFALWLGLLCWLRFRTGRNGDVKRLHASVFTHSIQRLNLLVINGMTFGDFPHQRLRKDVDRLIQIHPGVFSCLTHQRPRSRRCLLDHLNPSQIQLTQVDHRLLPLPCYQPAVARHALLVLRHSDRTLVVLHLRWTVRQLLVRRRGVVR